MTNENVRSVPADGKAGALISVGLIAALYLFSIGLRILAIAFFSGLATKEAGSEVFAAEIFLYLGLFVLAVIEAVGLFRRDAWARIFGIVLGLLLMAPQIFAFYMFGSSLNDTVQSFGNPFLVFNLFAIGYLVFPKFHSNWKALDKFSIAMALVLSILAIALVAANMQNYHAVVRPFRLKLAAEEKRQIQGDVNAGTVYKDPKYGFELTFPVKETIFQEGDGLMSFSRNSSHKEDPFSVEITDVYDGQDSPEAIAARILKFEPKDKVETVVINGNTGVKVLHWPGYGSFEYIFIWNGKLIHFENGGGMPPDEFDPIIQTLKFKE